MENVRRGSRGNGRIGGQKLKTSVDRIQHDENGTLPGVPSSAGGGGGRRSGKRKEGCGCKT